MFKQLLACCMGILVVLSCQRKKQEDNPSLSPKSSAENEFYQKANKFLEEGVQDSSFIYFDLASDEFLKKGDTLYAGGCLIQMAVTLYEIADYYGAQETSLEAERLFDPSNEQHQSLMAFNYNNLGNAISGYGDYEAALAYYDLAIEFSKDTLDQNVYTNNKAVTLYELKRYKEALAIHQKNLAAKSRSDEDYARVLSNYANTRWRIDPSYDPLPDLHHALAIRKKYKSDVGLNSSYNHLFQYHEDRNLDSAKIYARKSYAQANKINVSSDKIIGAEKLIKVSDRDSAKYYFRIYKHLTDSVRTARLKARNQYALIRYEVEKSKNENLVLQKAVLDRDLQMTKERVVIVGIAGLLLSVLVYYIVWTQRRKQRIRLEAENKIKEVQLKTSKKVHDVVANGIYRVMTELEYQEEIDKEDLLDKLELMYETSRDISYEEQEISKVNNSFDQELSNLLRSFAHQALKIWIIGNDAAIWKDYSINVQNDLRIILQEIMVNMKKHSFANEVIIKFEGAVDGVNIVYQDNGVGMPKTKKIGNGIRNTENRMERIGGTINFVSENGKGLKIELYVPYA